jgi:glyoxylase-like metal-dependent hydrolase (beta-lactamase superfamily II)
LGTCWFPEAIVLSHALCRRLLNTIGRTALDEARRQSRDLWDVRLVLPDIVFSDGQIGLRIEKRTLQLIHLPGHSVDGIGVLLVEDRVLFSGDIMMPLPYLVDGDYDVMIETMNRIPNYNLENLVQGHGEVILRGEVPLAVKENIAYLSVLKKRVNQASRRRDPRKYLESIDVESCGKSRILLNGLVEELHTRNLFALYHQWHGEF